MATLVPRLDCDPDASMCEACPTESLCPSLDPLMRQLIRSLERLVNEIIFRPIENAASHAAADLRFLPKNVEGKAQRTIAKGALTA